METTGISTIKYQNPPIHEVACGILFDSIKGLHTGQFGILWQKFRPDFPNIEEHNPLPPVSEEDLKHRNQLPPTRVWFVHQDVNEVVQVQFNRFIHNWRKKRPDDEYPGYGGVIENFEDYLSRFKEFLVEENLEGVKPKLYDLTYFDHILQHEGWESLNDLGNIFPNLISPTVKDTMPAHLREFHTQLLFGLPNDFGQLQLSIQSVHRLSDERRLFRIAFTAQSNEPYEPMRDWFDIAHREIVQLFTNLISDEIQNRYWGMETC